MNTEPKNQITLNNSDKYLNNKKSYYKRNLIKIRKVRFGVLKFKKFRQYILTILITVLLLNFFFIYQNSNHKSKVFLYSQKEDYQGDLQASGQEIFDNQPWLNDTSFDNLTDSVWFASYGDLGDKSDVDAKLDDNHYANLTVIGETHTFSEISGTPNSSTSLNWYRFNNPEFPADPDNDYIDEYGCYADHYWYEEGDQSPSVHWERNVTMPVNMSDYIITSANLSAVVNATVTAFPGGVNSQPTPGYGVEVAGDDTGPYQGDNNQFFTGDYVRFYVLLSDLEKSKVYEAAYIQPVDLGKDSAGATDDLIDTLMTTVPEEDLIFFITSILSSDYRNFTITLGIRIWCEDNWYSDRDRWDSLRIKSFNLTFTYEKRVDQFTSVSWNQDASKISDISHISNETVVLNKAVLNFKYRIDQNWTELSPNSELRILINNNPHTETVKLSSANSTFQLANKFGGFDVTHLIVDDVNVSIQLYLADEFRLNSNITISIDDVELNITYTIIFPPHQSDYQLFLNKDLKTLDPNLELFVGEQLNITIKYTNKTGAHIPNATVLLSGNFTGTLKENKALEQYSIIIDTDVSNLGVNFLTIVAYSEDYEIQEIYPIITINKFISQGLDIFLNNENMTLDPEIELKINEDLNITVVYRDSLGNHISNASVRLFSEGITKDLNESSIFQHYTTIINTSDRLRIGLNYLNIEAQHSIYQTKEALIRLYVRKFNVDISTVSGSNRIEIKAGKDINLRINLNNTDIDELIKGAVVTYVWEHGDGILTDPDNDGIYEGTIENVPEGAFTVVISAFAGDDYDIQEYDLAVIAVGESQAEAILFQILFIVSVIVTIGLISYLYAYLTYLKYPRQVRKVRKYRKTLKRESAPKIPIIGRESSFKSLYNKSLGKAFRMKQHPAEESSLKQKLPPEKPKSEEISQKVESERLIEKSLEKKGELDKIIDKSLDKNTKPS